MKKRIILAICSLMIMGGGMDARGLADEMAAAQRRIMSGYGS